MILFLIAQTYISCSEEPIEPPDFDPEPLDLLERLQNLAGVEVTEIAPDGPYVRAFQIDITQPVDHNNPGGQTFTQRAYLSHLDESACSRLTLTL